jgi:hypothetical protein
MNPMNQMNQMNQIDSIDETDQIGGNNEHEITGKNFAGIENDSGKQA